MNLPLPASFVEKGWGIRILKHAGSVGEIFVYNDKDEQTEHKIEIKTVKALYFGKEKRLSNHFHRTKQELFCTVQGRIKVEYILPDATKKEIILEIGDRIFIPQCMPHRMTGLDDFNILIEVSTQDSSGDNFRIERGD